MSMTLVLKAIITLIVNNTQTIPGLIIAGVTLLLFVLSIRSAIKGGEDRALKIFDAFLYLIVGACMIMASDTVVWFITTCWQKLRSLF